MLFCPDVKVNKKKFMICLDMQIRSRLKLHSIFQRFDSALALFIGNSVRWDRELIKKNPSEAINKRRFASMGY